MPVEYDYAANRHTLDSPRTVIPILFSGRKPGSLLDVGCGIGTWLRVAREFGIEDIKGVDGVEIHPPIFWCRLTCFVSSI